MDLLSCPVALPRHVLINLVVLSLRPSTRDALVLDLLRCASGHPLQLPKRIQGRERNKLEAHQVCLAERQLLQHLVCGSRVGYVQDERDAASALKREPLINLAVQIELHRFAYFGRQD
jgi:hypothetical protein